VSALEFRAAGARVEPYAAVPTFALALQIDERTGQRIQSISLQCQIRIEPERRSYDPVEAAQLDELFGAPTRWGDTQKPFLWTHVTTMVPSFTGSTDVDLFLPVSYDLDVAAARYLHALRDGDIPLLLLFSGSVFAPSGTGGISVEQIPWDREARLRLPVRLWRELMDAYYPNSGWLRLSRDVLDELGDFKARNAIPTWDQAVGALLARRTTASGRAES
jgi:Family of unknown function (DUF6084)